MWNHPFELFSAPTPETNADDAAGVYAAEPPTLSHRWPRCGGRMIIIEDLRTRRDGRQLTMLMAVRCDARGRWVWARIIAAVIVTISESFAPVSGSIFSILPRGFEVAGERLAVVIDMPPW